MRGNLCYCLLWPQGVGCRVRGEGGGGDTHGQQGNYYSAPLVLGLLLTGDERHPARDRLGTLSKQVLGGLCWAVSNLGPANGKAEKKNPTHPQHSSLFSY